MLAAYSALTVVQNKPVVSRASCTYVELHLQFLLELRIELLALFLHLQLHLLLESFDLHAMTLLEHDTPQDVR